MLGKLIKHEFRATGRVMGPLYLILLLLSIGANGSIRILGSSDSRFLTVMSGLLLTLFVIVIVALCIMTLVVMIRRFHTNLLGDEGYVMLTLPASIHEQIWSKLIVSTVWVMASGLAVCLSVFITVFRVSYVNDFVEMFRQIITRMNTYYMVNGTAFVLELLVLLIVASVASCLQFYAAMSVGHSFANHKCFLSVVFFFVFQIILQILGTFGLFTSVDSGLFNSLYSGNGVSGLHAAMGISIVCTVVLGAAFYFLTAYMLKKHLNLE